jgi:hypothetical protein
MSLLADINPSERDDHISFQEEGHVYTIDGDRSFVSTTTWVHRHFKPFDADVIIAKMMRSKKWPQSKYFGQTPEEIKVGWNANGRAASEAGTKLHADIEAFFNGIPIVNDSLEYSYFQNFEKDHRHLTPFRTEWYVWDKKHKLCGSIDMIYDNGDGTFSIYDWKRCKEIKQTNDFGERGLPDLINHLHDCNFYHYALQLNVYKALLEKNYGLRVTDLAIVCLHPSNANGDYQKYTIPDLQREVGDLLLERLEEVSGVETEEIEVEERVLDGVSYLVDNENNIVDEGGNVVGVWPPDTL